MTQTNSNKKVVLLGIESSGITCGAGVSVDNRHLKEMSKNGKNVHSEKLAVFIESILIELRIAIEDLSGIVLSAGPGSFTGLRIGYSLAKGIAHHSKIPIIEVSTLDVWAYQLGERNSKIMAVIDAYRREVFYSLYKREQDRFARITDYSITNIENLAEIITERIHVSGAISDDIKSEITEVSPLAVFDNGSAQPSMKALLELGYQKYELGEISDLNNCEPFYMRKFKGVS